MMMGPWDLMVFLLCSIKLSFVKSDFIEMFNAWHDDNLDIYRYNFVMITLIPKENDAWIHEEN
jgi:hypothetical protein